MANTDPETVQVEHPRYGGREIKPEQLEAYLGTGWSETTKKTSRAGSGSGDKKGD